MLSLYWSTVYWSSLVETSISCILDDAHGDRFFHQLNLYWPAPKPGPTQLIHRLDSLVTPQLHHLLFVGHEIEAIVTENHPIPFLLEYESLHWFRRLQMDFLLVFCQTNADSTI